jgi:membrane-associated phospholipid phosphatase
VVEAALVVAAASAAGAEGHPHPLGVVVVSAPSNKLANAYFSNGSDSKFSAPSSHSTGAYVIRILRPCIDRDYRDARWM